MVSRAADSSSNLKKLEAEHGKETVAGGLPAALSRLKKQIQSSRVQSIKEKLAKNEKKLEACTTHLSTMATSRKDLSMDQGENKNMLSYKIDNPLYKIVGSESGFWEKENMNSQEELQSSTIVFGNSSSGKCAVRPIKLPFTDKIPPYTTWIFLARNQKMTDDQSVVGRRQIYYQQGGETVICSDSDGELAEPEEEKHDFIESEDQFIWKALHEYGSSPEVFNILAQYVEATSSEIEERYEALLKKNQNNDIKSCGSSGEMESERILFLDRTVAAALDSFDTLFCRRCFIFDCRLHGCSQSVIIPSEKQQISVEAEDNGKPCGAECYLSQRSGVQNSCNTPSSSGAMTETEHTDNGGKRKVSKHENLLPGSTKNADDIPLNSYKKPKNLSPDNIYGCTDANIGSITITKYPDLGSHSGDQHQDRPIMESTESFCNMDIVPCDIGSNKNTVEEEANSLIEAPAGGNLSEYCKEQRSLDWNPFEKDLYLKGVEIFGKNSCLIARNLLSGLKTCMEVSKYMFNDGAIMLNRTVPTKSCSENNATDADYMEQEMPTRTRIWRRRGRARKLKYTWKSAGHPSIRKRIADGKEQCKLYVPCGCQQMCGKQCPCLQNGTCCEKYCGCSKSCKNRFRGCHCAKSQCRSRQCPCFAAGRECDPDVCRNCWVSCGDGSLGEPPARGDGYQCGNMKLFLKQQQRILLGRSDVAGWGAFIKNPVNKNDYLGEYTGELISHKEADKRGKIYDRANSSFLFDLNDEYVLDAYRKGDKLKFANHSSNPNCYAKVMLVAGDHRVGIFAKEHIEASEELFYDYRYGPDQAPAWARKPEGSKRDDSSSHSRRAHKVA